MLLRVTHNFMTMNLNGIRYSFLATLLVAGSSLACAQTNLAITEAYSAGSGNGTYAADWFELTNFGDTPVNIAGFKVDDSSQSPAGSFALRGITSIAAGQSVIFIEGTASGSTDASRAADFNTAWFGTATSLLSIGGYGGTGLGLSTDGDGLNIYNPSSATPSIPLTNLDFGIATTGFTFDNAARINSYVAPFTILTTLSSVGINGAFTSFNGQEVGSPGFAPIPEPSTYAALVSVGVFGVALLRRRKLAAVLS
jgi:hypothetical protein